MIIIRHQSAYTYFQLMVASMMLLVSGSIFGQEFEIKNGVNIQASYYNEGYVNMGWELMAEYPEIEAVRIEIEPNRVHQARNWIREAQEHGYQVIATYHDFRKLGSDKKDELLKAANWWKKNYESLSSFGPIIINLMNEWGSHDIPPEDYAIAYNEAIDIIRPFYSDPIIVDVPGFGQATKIAADAYTYMTDENFIYSVHIYTSAFNIEQNRWMSHEDLAYLDATGANCMVGEFCDNSSGGSDWCSIIDDCYVNGWPLFGWAWNGDGANMNMIEPHWRDDPLAETFSPTEFMKVVIDKLAGIPCYTQADEECMSHLIGEPCNDKNEYTINDRYNEYCHCTGTFISQFQSNISEMDMVIYPNPVGQNQQLSIEMFKVFVKGDIKIINSIGNTLLTQHVNQDEQIISIDTHGLPSGLYWASFQDDENVFMSKAFFVTAN